ncbi:MAG: PxKF domain-containing protein [Luteimonas sp.]|nr:PxKF domain-containing protein [Luteimonas sp.]
MDGSAVDCWRTQGFHVEPGSAALDVFGSIGAGELHSCQLGADGVATCWGYNDAGRATPPAGLLAALSVGSDHNCGLRDDGQAICWGDNRYGQATAPAGVFRQIDSGDSYSCAMRDNGEPACWGWNVNGQATPPPVPVGRAYLSIDAGFVHSCAILDDSTGFCWGYNGDGETDVPAGTWLAIRAGGQHSCGLRSDGSITCWGRNAEGQAGNVPAGVFEALSAGRYHSCAIRQDGTLACWGLNSSGQATPPGGTYVSLASGALHNCAIRSDGVRKCWGYGSAGQAPDVELRPAVLPVAREGRAFSVQVLLRDARDFYLPPMPGFAVVEGALPPGLAFAADGLLSGTPTTPGSYAFTLEGEDRNGFAATRSYALEVLIPDPTPPVVTPVVTGTLGDGDWYTSDVQVAWTVDDPDSAIESTTGCEAVVLSTDSAAAGFTCTATSAGGSSSETVTIKRDATAPETLLSTAPADPNGSPDASFVLEAQAEVSGLAAYECSLDGAEFSACNAMQSYQALSDGLHTFAARAIDGAGNVDATPITHAWTIDVDHDAPLIEPIVTGLLGDNGWYVGDVQVSWSVSDPDSPISETTGCNAITLATDTAGAGFTCSATSLGGTASQTVTIKRDVTAPVVTATASAPANAAGWYRNDVTVQHSCSDALSGVVACPADQVLSAEGVAVASSAVSVVDQAGNHSAPSNVVTVKLDKTAPTLAANVSPNPLLLNANAFVTTLAGDALSGPGPALCAALATGTVGSKTVTCSVEDLAGNSATASADYRVVYGFAGFVAPLQVGASWNAAQTRRSIPFGWRVFDANNAAVTTLTAVTITRTTVACPGSPQPVPLASYGGNSTALRHLGAGNYRRDWLVSANFGGTCARMRIDLGDGIAHDAMFKFD